jgi:hypothetical protein
MINAFNGSVRNSRLQCHFANSFETNGIAAPRTRGISIRSSPSADCTRRGQNPLRFPGGPPGRRSQRARPNQLSNSSSTAR